MIGFTALIAIWGYPPVVSLLDYANGASILNLWGKIKVERAYMKAELIDYMGSDLTVVNAARVSFDKEHREFDASRDTKLISYLANHNHFTPFTHCTITLRETVPIFVARQRFKHTVGFTYNEISRRYVDSEPELYYPEEWRNRAANKKQGSEGRHKEQELCKSLYAQAVWECQKAYNKLLDIGVCPEQARMVLPQSMYTSYYVTGSLAAWARAYKLRTDPHAQQEIRELAYEWEKLIRPLFPVSWEALVGKVVGKEWGRKGWTDAQAAEWVRQNI
jgi:thymidylate synthase (FAD)